MARPRANPVKLESDQIEMLTRISKAKSEELRRVQRAKILLMAAEGETDQTIAAAVSLNKNSVRNTISKFSAMGVDAALTDLAREGRPSVIGDDDIAWVTNLACIKPKDLGYAQELWTIEKLTQHIRENCESEGHKALSKVATSKVWTILDNDELKPHRIGYFLERRDPGFDAKMKNVLMLYKEVDFQIKSDEKSDVIAISFDEKPGIQAIANVAPDLPPTTEHGFWARDYEHKRLGTTSLLAGLNLITGEVTGLVRDTHKSSDFIDFLKIVDEKYQDYHQIRLVLDNHSVHTSKETRAYLETRPGRFDFVFTPKHGSWLNLIESFFGKLARVCLRGMRVSSKEELVAGIYRYLDEINRDPVIYRWKFKLDEVEI
jgi:transposase